MFKRIKGTGVMKKTAAFALSLVMASGAFAVLPGGAAVDMFSISASALETGWYEYKGNKFEYSCENGQAQLKGYNLSKTDNVILPDKIVTHSGTYTVTSLGNYFGANMKATKVTIPDTVKTIGDQAFREASINTLNISKNLTKIGTYFCYSSHVVNAYCFSKALTNKNIGDYCFYKYDDSVMNKIIIGNTLIKYDINDATLDLTSSEFANITRAWDNAFYLGENVKTLKTGDNAVLLDKSKYFDNPMLRIERVYYNGNELVCTSKDQVLPDIIAKNNSLAGESKFAVTFANDKAKLLLNSMGLTYYGSNSDFFKGKQSAAYEYMAVRKIHDYMSQNYIYDKVNGSDPYLKSFNCGTPHVCNQDAALCAFLLENAGVEVEVVSSGVPRKTSCEEASRVINDTGLGQIDTDENLYYVVDKWGSHSWNYVRIDGNWYQMDSTNDRSNDCYWLFLKSDAYMRDYVIAGQDVCPHAHPYYQHYRAGQMRFFQQHNDPFEALPACTHLHGDANKDGNVNENDVRTIRAFCSIPKDIQNKLLNNEDLTDAEINIINGTTYVREESFVPGAKPTKTNVYVTLLKDGERKFDQYALDVNFDGTIDMSDAVELERTLMNPNTIHY